MLNFIFQDQDYEKFERTLAKKVLHFTSEELDLLEAVVDCPVHLLDRDPHPVRDHAVGQLDDVPVLVPLGGERGGMLQPSVPEHQLYLLVCLAGIMSLQELDLTHSTRLAPARLYPRPHPLPG